MFRRVNLWVVALPSGPELHPILFHLKEHRLNEEYKKGEMHNLYEYENLDHYLMVFTKLWCWPFFKVIQKSFVGKEIMIIVKLRNLFMRIVELIVLTLFMGY
ncbi:hypothetical protein LguiA_007445 [Lonicera macranthoides]